jgi:hypothetical protein
MNALKTLRLLPILLVLLGASNIAQACTCLYMGTFENYSSANPIVVRATVSGFGDKLFASSDYYASLVAEITEIYKGEITSTSITLLGDRGMDCRSYIDPQQFEAGNEYLFSLSSGDSTQILGGCGESFVKIEGSLILGSGLVDGKWGTYSL